MKLSPYRCFSVLVVFAGLTFGLVASEEAQGEKGKGKKDKGKNAPNIVQIDLSKLPPGIAQYVLEQAGVAGAAKEEKGKGKDMKKGESTKADEKKKDKKGDAKMLDAKKGEGKKAGKGISLADAISIAERSAGGTAIKADRKGEPGAYSYRIEVQGSDGARTKIQLDAKGRPAEPEPNRSIEKKGKGKGKGNQDP